MSDYETIRELIKAALYAQRVTQTDLARRSGQTVNRVGDFMRGQHDTTSNRASAMIRALGGRFVLEDGKPLIIVDVDRDSPRTEPQGVYRFADGTRVDLRPLVASLLADAAARVAASDADDDKADESR